MAMVTRTFTTSKVQALTMNIVTCESEVVTFIVPKVYDNEEKLLKALRKDYETDTVKVVAITSNEKVETLYGLDETDFIKYAIELDKETRKPINN